MNLYLIIAVLIVLNLVTLAFCKVLTYKWQKSINSLNEDWGNHCDKIIDDWAAFADQLIKDKERLIEREIQRCIKDQQLRDLK